MDEQKEMDKLRGEIEAYKGRLKNEFGYSNKDIKADQDLQAGPTQRQPFL